jgi:molecular chaperone DnaK
MSRIIGIDLGTTNSCVAALDDRGQPTVLCAQDGSRTTPSMVAFTDGGVLVGEAARRQLVVNPSHTVFGTKRLIGRKVSSPDVRWVARSAPFRIVAATNGDAWVRVGNEPRSPQEIASHVIRHLKAIAEVALGEPVTRAVVTVPAYFDDAQRQATKDAGTIAGVDVVRILNEPTAAALAYGVHRGRPGRHVIAVFDLGGGTFDISIMAVEDGVFEVLATAGDASLGGDDWDRRLIDRISDEMFDQHRVDLTSVPLAMGRLKESVEGLKRVLAHINSELIRLPYLAQHGGCDLHLERRVTRTEFEAMTADLIERLRAPCEQALRDAGLTAAEVEEVLLVGGMTRWPKVQEAVIDIFGRAPSKTVNPDEVVALGAAAHAGILAGSLDDAVLLDVTAHTIGVKVGDSGYARMIPRNSILPVRDHKLFATNEDDQTYVKVEIYQGESDDLLENRKLGEVKLTGLSAGKAGSVKVELTMTVDVESILRVSARELRTGKRADVTIAPSGGLSQEDLVRIVNRRRHELGDDPPPSELERPGEK